MQKHTYRILVPGGNKTALVLGLVTDKAKRRIINDNILFTDLSDDPIEQVGFVDTEDMSKPRLLMAGGEFCGNATRSAAWFYCDGKPGKIVIDILNDEGETSVKLQAGVRESNIAWAQMPLEDLKITEPESGAYVVSMKGISHVVMLPSAAKKYLTAARNNAKTQAEFEKNLKKAAEGILRDAQYDLWGESAAGVIFEENTADGLSIHPCVHVSSVNTMYYETACGSGTIATALVESVKKNAGVSLPIKQPSGKFITAAVEREGGVAVYAEIAGEIECDGDDRTVSQFHYFPVVKRPSDLNKNEKNKSKLAEYKDKIIQLYADCFRTYPYYELYSREEIKGMLDRYLEYGNFIFCLDEESDAVVGFVAAIPVKHEPEISEFAQSHGVDWDDYWYHAELGTADSHRHMGIGTELVKQAIHFMNSDKIVMRTHINNIASQKLHEKLGFVEEKNIEQQLSRPRVEDIAEEDRRIFLVYKKK